MQELTFQLKNELKQWDDAHGIQGLKTHHQPAADGLLEWWCALYRT